MIMKIRYSKKHILWHGFLAIFVTLLVTQSSLAENNEFNKFTAAKELVALQFAVADTDKRLSIIPPNMRLSYIREKNDNEGNIQTYKFLPKGSSSGKWVGVETKYSRNNQSGKTWDNDTLLLIEQFDISKAKLKVEKNNSWVFEVPTFIQINVNSEVPEEEKSQQLSAIISAELEVSKINPRFISYQLYSLSAFEPEFAVKVAKFSIHNVLQEAWTNGPLVTIKQTEKVQGKVGFFIDIDENITVTNSNFSLVEVTL